MTQSPVYPSKPVEDLPKQPWHLRPSISTVGLGTLGALPRRRIQVRLCLRWCTGLAVRRSSSTSRVDAASNCSCVGWLFIGRVVSGRRFPGPLLPEAATAPFCNLCRCLRRCHLQRSPYALRHSQPKI
jgi:hypothetical protein